VKVDPEVVGATPGDKESKVEDVVGCLPPLPLIGSLLTLCGVCGIGSGKLSMFSCCSKSVSPVSGISSGSDTSSLSNSLTSCSSYTGASSMTGSSVSTLHGLVVSIESNTMASMSGTLFIYFTHNL
jgi:hypothetical protein